MKQLAFFLGLIWFATTLLLAACSPVALAPTSTLTPTPNATMTPTVTVGPPNFVIGVVPPFETLPVQHDASSTLTLQIGGTLGPLTVDGEMLYFGIGPRLAAADISDPVAPRLVWQSDVFPGTVNSIAVQPGRLYARAERTLLIFSTSNSAEPVLLGSFSEINGEIIALGDVVYANNAAIDTSNPANPTLQTLRNTARVPAPEAVNSQIALYTLESPILNNTDPGALLLVQPENIRFLYRELPLPTASRYHIILQDSQAILYEVHIFTPPDILRVLDVSDPANPKETAFNYLRIGSNIRQMLLAGDTLILLVHSFPHFHCPSSLVLIDISDPTAPQRLPDFQSESCFNRIANSGDLLVATTERGLQLYDVATRQISLWRENYLHLHSAASSMCRAWLPTRIWFT